MLAIVSRKRILRILAYSNANTVYLSSKKRYMNNRLSGKYYIKYCIAQMHCQ